jgi:rRNA maturation protein Nop10
MTKNLQKCKSCNEYGIANSDSKCRFCGGQLISPKPPKFSLVDKYGKYRISYFKEKFRPNNEKVENG